jgi:hypothetical protein
VQISPTFFDPAFKNIYFASNACSHQKRINLKSARLAPVLATQAPYKFCLFTHPIWLFLQLFE